MIIDKIINREISKVKLILTEEEKATFKKHILKLLKVVIKSSIEYYIKKEIKKWKTKIIRMKN